MVFQNLTENAGYEKRSKKKDARIFHCIWTVINTESLRYKGRNEKKDRGAAAAIAAKFRATT
jgi:hypothetical protein